jgi:lysophospholipase L1-like esterase
MALLSLGFVTTEGILQWELHHSREKAFVWRLKNFAAFAARFDPFLQVVPKPNNEELHINRWGFRGEEIERIKPAQTYRIFVVGGSTVYCNQVSFEQSHARVLEKQLRQSYPTLKIEVQNAGMDWHTSQHSLINILFNIQDFNPDMIIIYHGINDLLRSFSPKSFAPEPYRNDYSHYYGPIAPMVREYFTKPTVPAILTLERALIFFRRHWFADFRDVSKPDAILDLLEVPVNNWPSLLAFERNMKHLVKFVKSLDIDLVMASQPYLYRHDLSEVELAKIWLPEVFCLTGRSKADIASMINGMEAFNNVSRRIADSNGLLFVDLEKVVPKSLHYFLDDVHYTEEGNRIIGQHFAEQVIAGGYINRKFPKRTAFQ